MSTISSAAIAHAISWLPASRQREHDRVVVHVAAVREQPDAADPVEQQRADEPQPLRVGVERRHAVLLM